MPQSGQSNDDGGGRPAGREDFEIAIICALPLESSALSYLLDEFFDGPDGDGDPYQKIDSDPNYYTTGRIGKHNVVIVLLPGMGKAHAASAAAYLRASYSNVRLALVVGICGGVPGPNKNGDEVFLGDVVISNSLIQYDLRRQYPGGIFLCKNTSQDNLGRLNKNLRALLKSFETDRNRDKLERRTAHYLRELQATYAKRTTRKSAKYKYPGTDEDKLFEAGYRHRHRFSECCNETTTCDQALDSSCDEVRCEKKYLVDRDGIRDRRKLEEEDPTKAQEPAIYLGPVASGDTVMKSGEDRDRIAKEEGILAFEMEGAGVWDELQCIVVKGVCDYADSHKRKRWQDFAAATAASATKALLEALVTVYGTSSLLSRHEMPSALGLFRRQGRNPLCSPGQQLQFMQLAAQNRLVPEIQFQSVLVIDARGQYLPFFLETINSKELFVEVLRSRFKDLGYTKIDRGEWSLEDTKTGEILDLSQPWQVIVKRDQLLKMSMNFRRRNVPTTECPSCSFMNEGLPTEQVICNVCGLTYCRIEEVQEIEVQEEIPSPVLATATLDQDGIANQFPRPRPPKRLHPDEDISRYKHVRIIDTSFKILRVNKGDVSTNRATFNARHLHDTEFLAEELARHWGLPEEDCMRVLTESEAQLSALRAEFLNRSTLRELNKRFSSGEEIPGRTSAEAETQTTQAYYLPPLSGSIEFELDDLWNSNSIALQFPPPMISTPTEPYGACSIPMLSEHPSGSSRSQPVSVASLVTSDSPATPAGEPKEHRRRSNAAIAPFAKLDRTVTDAYGDELYSPNFTITSSSAGQAPMSRTSDLFNQRLQAANQHLSAVTSSPASTASRARSPFRQESPMAHLPMHYFPTTVGSSQVHFGSVQQIREDTQAMQHQMARSAETSTPAAALTTPQNDLAQQPPPPARFEMPLTSTHGGAGPVPWQGLPEAGYAYPVAARRILTPKSPRSTSLSRAAARSVEEALRTAMRGARSN